MTSLYNEDNLRTFRAWSPISCKWCYMEYPTIGEAINRNCGLVSFEEV